MKGTSATADRILRAARRIVVRRGYSSLSMKAVEKEVKASSSLVHYHFGGKSGLVEALIDSMFRRWEAWEDVPDSAEPRDDLHRSMTIGHDLAVDHGTSHLFFELLPHILRTKRLRERLAGHYARVRETDARFLQRSSAMSDRESAQLASLISAVAEGLGLQLTVDPDNFDDQGAFALWTRMVDAHLSASGRADG
jgi:AcrR family transcriptional regulator